MKVHYEEARRTETIFEFWKTVPHSKTSVTDAKSEMNRRSMGSHRSGHS